MSILSISVCHVTLHSTLHLSTAHLINYAVYFRIDCFIASVSASDYQDEINKIKRIVLNRYYNMLLYKRIKIFLLL